MHLLAPVDHILLDRNLVDADAPLAYLAILHQLEVLPLSLALSEGPQLKPGGATALDEPDLEASLLEPILVVVVHIRGETLLRVLDADVGKAVACAEGQRAKDAPEVLAEGAWPESQKRLVEALHHCLELLLRKVVSEKLIPRVIVC